MHNLIIKIMDKKDKVQKILNTLSRIEKNKIPHIKNRINMDKITEVKEFKKAFNCEGLSESEIGAFIRNTKKDNKNNKSIDRKSRNNSRFN